MEASPVDKEFEEELISDASGGSTVLRRPENPQILLAKFLWHEAKTAPVGALDTIRNVAEMMDFRRRPEAWRKRVEAEVEAKECVDGAFWEAGFSFHTLEVTRASDRAKYRKQILYRSGDVHPERCLVLSHGLTAGYESFFSVLGQRTMDSVAVGDIEAAREFDSPLRDYSILLENRSGVDAGSSALFVDTYDPSTHVVEQAAGQRASVEFAREMGARDIRIGGHSNGGLVTLEHLRKPLPKEVRGAVLINGLGNVNDSLIWRLPGVPQLVESLARSARGSQSEQGHWTQSALHALVDFPILRRAVPRFTPEEVANTLANTVIIDRMMGDIDLRSDIYLASKHRFRNTDWRLVVLDLHASSHARPLRASDHLINMHSLVIDSRNDRLVRPGVAQRLVREIDPFVGTDVRTTDYKLIPAGHFPQAEDPDKMNRVLARYLAGQRQS